MGSQPDKALTVSRLWSDLPLVAKGIVAIGFPIVILTFGYSLYSDDISREAEAERWVAHSEVVRSDLRRLLAGLVAMESAARGYAISRHPELRNRFFEQKDKALRGLDGLEQEVADNPIQLDRMAHLRPIVSNKIEEMEKFLVPGVVKPSSELERILLRSEGAMKPVRGAIERLDHDESRLQKIRRIRFQEQHNESIKTIGITISVGLLSIVGSLLLFTVSLRRRMKRLQLSARALRTELPLAEGEEGSDEIGQLQSELERTSEVIASRTRDLRASEAQLRAIVDNTTAIVYVKDIESRFVLVNAEYERVFGLKSEQAIGHGPVELFGRELGGALRANDLQVIKSRKPAQFEERLLRQGKVLTYISVKVPLLDEDGEPYGICGISTDITTRKASETEMSRNVGVPAKVRFVPEMPPPQAATATVRGPGVQDPLPPRSEMDVLSQVAGSVAHDFNNILATIIGYANLLLAGVDEENREASPAAEILRASERAAGLTKQLLTLSHTLPARTRVLDVAAVLARFQTMLAPRLDDRISVQMEVDPGIGRIRCDQDQIEHLLLNLAVNARDAMPHGGRIEIRAAAVSLPAAQGRVKAGKFVSICVRDEGKGIPPEVQARMYEPFFTTKRAGEGYGLGLAISAMIARQSNGWLSCKSELGAGSAFTLFLPAVNEPLTPLPTDHEKVTLPGGSETVLVVEDEPMVAELEALLLRNLGYKVMLAEGSSEAEQVIAQSGRIDLVLTDLGLTEVGGRELVERVRKNNPGMKFILISGSEEAGDVAAEVAAAPEPTLDFLMKPFEIRTLADKVRRLLDR